MKLGMENRYVVETVINDFYVNPFHFVICKDNKGCYWGFSKTDFENGVTFNGATGHLGDTLNETLRHCYQRARVMKEINKELLDNCDKQEWDKFQKIVTESYILFPDEVKEC